MLWCTSDEKYYNENITKVKLFSNENKYPNVFINEYVTSRLNKIRHNNNNFTKVNRTKNYNKVVVIPFVEGINEESISWFKKLPNKCCSKVC